MFSGLAGFLGHIPLLRHSPWEILASAWTSSARERPDAFVHLRLNLVAFPDFGSGALL